MTNSVYLDGEEFVVEKALNCLASLCDLGIFRKSKLLEICKTTAPLLLHPNTWIRFGAVALMSSIGNKLSLADVHCFLIPCLRPFMVRDIVDVSKTGLLESLKPPVRSVLLDISAHLTILSYVGRSKELREGFDGFILGHQLIRERVRHVCCRTTRQLVDREEARHWVCYYEYTFVE